MRTQDTKRHHFRSFWKLFERLQFGNFLTEICCEAEIRYLFQNDSAVLVAQDLPLVFGALELRLWRASRCWQALEGSLSRIHRRAGYYWTKQREMLEQDKNYWRIRFLDWLSFMIHPSFDLACLRVFIWPANTASMSKEAMSYLNWSSCLFGWIFTNPSLTNLLEHSRPTVSSRVHLLQSHTANVKCVGIAQDPDAAISQKNQRAKNWPPTSKKGKQANKQAEVCISF